MPEILPSTAVVFGASGLVGRNLVRALVEREMRVVTLLRRPVPGLEGEPLPPGGSLQTPLPEDTVFFHLAAHRYNAAGFRTGQHDLLRINSALATQAYDFCIAHGITEVRAASSIAVYGANLRHLDDSRPLDLNAPPHASELMYGWSKRFGEVAAALYRDKYGIHTQSFRLSNPYGPFDETDESRAHVAPAFIIRALTGAGEFTVRGNPLAARDFIFVDDVVKVLIRSLARREDTAATNLGTGINTTVQDLARLVLKLCGADRPLAAKGLGTSDVLSRHVDTARLRRLYGVDGFIPLETGLAATIAWYARNLAESRSGHE